MYRDAGAPPPAIFPPTVANSALLSMRFHLCILNSCSVFCECSLIRCFFVVVYFTLPARNRLLCLLAFLKIIIDIWKTVKLLVCCLFCVVHTLRFSDFQGCQIFTQASVLINTLLINDLIANPSLSSEKSPETLQNGACVFLVVLLDVL